MENLCNGTVKYSKKKHTLKLYTYTKIVCIDEKNNNNNEKTQITKTKIENEAES